MNSGDLNLFFKHFNLTGKYVQKVQHLLITISNIHPEAPIKTVLDIISSKDYEGLALHNPLNNCFLNSTLNAISSCYSIRALLLNNTDLLQTNTSFFDQLSKDLKENLQHSRIPDINNPVTLKLKVLDFFQSLKQIVNGETTTAQNLRHQFGQIFSKEFDNNFQHDPSEFLVNLLQLRPTLSNLFQITKTKVKKCTICQNEFTYGKEFLSQLIFQPENSDIQTLIDNDLQDYYPDEANWPFCDNCNNNQPMILSTKLDHNPDILCVRLGRDWTFEDFLDIPVTPNVNLQYGNSQYNLKSVI